MEPGPDPDLVVGTRLVVANDAGARTAEAYGRLSPELYGYLVRAVRDREVAADLLADAFTRLLVEDQGGRWPEQTRPWLYRVCTNLVTSRGRRLQVASRVDRVLRSRYTEPREAGPDVEVLRRERRGHLDRALEQLTPDARLAILLAAQGFDGPAISRAIDRSESAARTLLCRSRVRLRELLREMER